MPAKKVDKKERKPRIKGKPKVLYFGGAQLDLLKRIESKAKASKKSFNEVIFESINL